LVDLGEAEIADDFDDDDDEESVFFFCPQPVSITAEKASNTASTRPVVLIAIDFIIITSFLS
jgi:hypothetical protein